MNSSRLLVALSSLACMAWHTTWAPTVQASEIIRQGVHHPHARVTRGGPHGPDGRAYDTDRTVRIPAIAKTAVTPPSLHAAPDHRLVIPSAAQLTRAEATPDWRVAGPRLQPLYLKGCSAEDYAVPANLGAGKGRQDFQLIVDSGSSTLAVASDKCRNCDVTPAYKMISGTTENTRLDAQYGSGAWRGIIVEDAVALGFAPARRMHFGAILTQDSFFHDSNCTYGARAPSLNQGIVGMGPPDLLLPGTGSYFMGATSALTEPTYSVALCDVDGFLLMGTPPASMMASDPVYTPMVPSYYYAVGMADIEVGGQPLGQSYDDFGPAVVDTGTSAIVLPPHAYKAFTHAVAVATGNALPPSFFDGGDCVQLDAGTSIAELNSELPSMGFAFYNPATPTEPTWVSLPATNSYLMLMTDAQQQLIACAGVVNSGPQYPQTILGNTIMRNMLTIFDLANGQVGFTMTQNTCG